MWARIPFEAWMSAFILRLCCSMQVVALLWADPPSKEPYWLSIRLTISELIPNENRLGSLTRQSIRRRKCDSKSVESIISLKKMEFFTWNPVIRKITHINSLISSEYRCFTVLVITVLPSTYHLPAWPLCGLGLKTPPLSTILCGDLNQLNTACPFHLFTDFRTTPGSLRSSNHSHSTNNNTIDT
jgi:hypothetical protein